MSNIEIAIGDVHGCYDELVELLATLEKKYGDQQAMLVFLGDLIDRGPKSAQVIELVRNLKANPAKYGWKNLVKAHCIVGNHEVMMLEGVEEWGSFRHWVGNSGGQTIESYGGMAKITDSDLDWLATLPCILFSKHRYFVHAGFMPGQTAAQQRSENCLWIREKFLHAKADPLWDKHIVHGHTPLHAGKPESRKVEQLTHRTNIDTGCYHTGVLTAAIFDADKAGAPFEFVQTKGKEIDYE